MLYDDIEFLRGLLYIAIENDDINIVLKVSQMLDSLINEYYRHNWCKSIISK